MRKTFYVYIMASKSRVLYTGITNSLARRVDQHKRGQPPRFTQKYHVVKLVWYELHGNAVSAISREKQIKAWTRWKKIILVDQMNPRWIDLSDQLT